MWFGAFCAGIYEYISCGIFLLFINFFRNRVLLFPRCPRNHFMTRVDSHNHTEKRAASEVLVSWFHIFVASIKEDDNKVLLLELTGEPISIIGKNYSNYIMAYIIENNFDVHDENRLYKYFSKYNEIIQQAICDVAVSRIDNIISDSSIVLDDISVSYTHLTLPTTSRV